MRNLIGLARDFVIGLLLVTLIGGIAGWIAGDNYALKGVLWIGGSLIAAVLYNLRGRRKPTGPAKGAAV